MKVAVVGASGRLGLALLDALYAAEEDVEVVAVVRNTSKLNEETRKRVSAVVQGDATTAETASAIMAHQPDFIVVSVGEPESRRASKVRGDSTRVLIEAMKMGESETKLIGVSSVGVGDSVEQMGPLVRFFLTRFLKHPFADHLEQERLMRELPAEKWIVIRPTALNDKAATGDYETRTEGKLRSWAVSRKDVAQLIVKQMQGKGETFYGKLVSITS